MVEMAGSTTGAGTTGAMGEVALETTPTSPGTKETGETKVKH